MKRVVMIDDEIHAGMLLHKNRLIEKHLTKNHIIQQTVLTENDQTLRLSHGTICAQIL
jgi:hypothetical protein